MQKETATQNSAAPKLKAGLRAQAKAVRGRAWVRHSSTAPQAVAERGARYISTMPGISIVAGYYAIRDELDPLALLRALHEKGMRVALPQTQLGPALTFREWIPGSPLVGGKFGIHEPDGVRPEVVPDLVLVPLLAFDQRGNRLGYGAGYYDAALRALRSSALILAMGVAFDEQELPEIPREPQDEPLNMILTPTRLISCGD